MKIYCLSPISIINIFLTICIGLIMSNCNYGTLEESHEDLESEIDNQTLEQEIKSYNDLVLHLDTTDYIGFHDKGYLAFCELFSCEEADSIVKLVGNPKVTLYAFHKLAFGGCGLKTEEAIEIIKAFELSTDTIGVWTSPTQRGQYLLKEEAANAIWMNENFPMTEEQEKYILEMRGF